MRSLKLALFIISLLFFNKGFAQDKNSGYTDFVKSFTRVINYPVELIRIRKPTVCLIKIQTDSSKNILDMKLSDSADSLLKIEFNKNKGTIETKYLVNYFRAEYENNNCTTYIIPLSFAMYQKQGPIQDVAINSLYEYSKFNGISLNGNVIFLNEIDRVFSNRVQ